MKTSKLTTEFVELIPEKIEDGVLYISIQYNTASHKCACGCGNKVVTPINPTGWFFSWNGEDISLYPSIGNWGFPCQSHYWITRNRIRWARKWDKSEINYAREKEKKSRERYFRKIRN